MPVNNPTYPNGLEVRKCSRCRLFYDQETFTCPTCHGDTQPTRIYNKERRESRSADLPPSDRFL